MAYAAFFLLALALFGPFDTYADYLFLVHMLQHLTLALAAAPLLLMAGVMPAFMWSMPRFLRQGVGAEFAVTGMARRVVSFATQPRVAIVLFVGALWIWHIPDIYDAAVRNELIHLAEHMSFLPGSDFVLVADHRSGACEVAAWLPAAADLPASRRDRRRRFWRPW